MSAQSFKYRKDLASTTCYNVSLKLPFYLFSLQLEFPQPISDCRQSSHKHSIIVFHSIQSIRDNYLTPEDVVQLTQHASTITLLT